MNSDKYKNNCLKLKNEVGMAVLKSKQTRVVYRDNQHIRTVHPYACFFRLIRLCDTIIYFFSPLQLRLYSLSKRRDVLYVCADYLYILLLFVCFLALPSLHHFLILSNCFFILVYIYSVYTTSAMFNSKRSQFIAS